MINLSVLFKRTFFIIVVLFCGRSLAATVYFDSQKFIEIASVRSISELETAKIALQKSNSPLVRAYAQSMITESAATLVSLRKLANDSHLYIYSDAELQTKARKYIFERKGKTFDTAYADMRAAECRKMVTLFREAVGSDEVLFKHYAETELPSLMHHLYMAQQLVEHVDSASTMLASQL